MHESDPCPAEPFADAAVPPPLPVIPAPRFCSGCGSAWQVDWLGCPVCAAKAAVPRIVIPLTPEGRPIRRSLALYFAWLAISVTTAIVMIVAPDTAIVADFAYGILTAVLAIAFAVAGWQEVRPGLTTVPHPKWFVVAALGSLVTYTIAAGAVTTLNKLFGMPELSYTAAFFSRGYGWWAVILAICVQPAVFEELGFRGVMLPGLQRILTAGEAVMVSSLLFMILHLAVPSFPHLLLIGLTLGFLRLRTGSLYPGILLHFCHNLLCVLSEQWNGMFPWS